MFPLIRDALLDALALVLPVDCAGCGRPDRALCDECRAALVPLVRRRVLETGLVVHAALDYDGVARRAIPAFKDGERVSLAGPLGRALRAAARDALDATAGSAPVFVPVPSSRAARRRRGMAPVEVLARHAGLRTARALAHASDGREQQKALGRADRARNLRGAFRARGPLPGVTVILVDDVVTTGATLVEACRVLEDAGARVAAAAVVASTPKRMHRPLTSSHS